MTERQRRWLAGALGAGLVALILVLATLDNRYRPDARPTTARRTVELYEPAPAPPPPPSSRWSDARSGGSTGRQLTLDHSRPPVVLDAMKLDVQLATADPDVLELGGLGEGFGVGSGDGTGDGSGTGYELVTLSELDQQPMVASAPVFQYPEEAVARGLGAFVLQFHVLIDEEGRTHPIAIVQNPFPALTDEFLDYASKVRFSPPTRLGIPVRTEYLWPVRVERPSRR